MPKISELVEKEALSPLQMKVLRYLNDHPDEVFSYRDEAELAQKINHDGSVHGIGFSLWALEKKGLIGKENYGRRVYFGSFQAINKLKEAKKKR